ncbi:mRNA cleavage and polyadenylation factor subunit [Orbilia oligospora]|uniref:mRNA cleavage and polyadenylation factor subunit n=1 Tax=Orbilia oligospora TaxID=2813651 RepID=A0A7C8VFB8_ORBOL|nr:mRNA cleavage and polyadenylation factor subunit [Orbilia oligospora]
MGSMQVYTEITDPTAVNNALALNFISSTERNLVVAKTSLLQIFRLVEYEDAEGEFALDEAKDEGGSDRRVFEGRDHEDSFTVESGMHLQRETIEKTTKLDLVAQYHLYGSVTSMVKIRIPTSKSGGDCLLVSFDSAKISLLEWDPAAHSISTISLHYYEGDEFRSPLTPEFPINYLISDPKSRCAAFKFNHDLVAILPFRQTEDEDLEIPDNDSFTYDLEDDDDAEKPKKDVEMKDNTGEVKPSDTPYHPSFVLSASQLDESVERIIDIVFLHEYREPTFGIVYQPQQGSVGMLERRKDPTHFIVVTLDLDQRASTSIMSAKNLPFDIWKAVALPPPIGGTLLLGEHEIVHVDQAGKMSAVAVNSYAQQYSAFNMTDQSDLELNLESCSAISLPNENGDVLIVTIAGDFAILSFKAEGRSISSLSVRRIQSKDGYPFTSAPCETLVEVGNRRFFLGSLDSDAMLWGYKRKGEKTSLSQKSEVKLERDDAEDNVEDDDDEDDLYGESTVTPITPRKASSGNIGRGSSGEYVFRRHDRLQNVGPCRQMAFGRPAMLPEKLKLHQGVLPELELMATTGRGVEGAVTVFNTSICPRVSTTFDFKDCQRLWAVHSKQVKKGQSMIPSSVSKGYEEQIGATEDYSTYLFASNTSETLVYKVGTKFEPLEGTDIETTEVCPTLEFGTFQDGLRIAQVCETNVKVYDSELQLIQIISTNDEDPDGGPHIVSASFADPYMLLICGDSSILACQCHERTLELDRIELPATIKDTKYTNGCLYTSSSEVFGLGTKSQVLCFLLTEEGTLQVFTLPNFELKATLEHFDMSLQLVSPDETALRFHTARDEIEEIIVADLGDNISKAPYLIVKTKRDDIIIYEPFISNGICFKKIYNTVLPTVSLSEQKSPSGPLVKIDDLGGYSVAFMAGDTPTFITKSSKTLPKLYKLQGGMVRSLSPFNTKETERGFLYIDSKGTARVCHFPEVSMEHTWLSQRIPLERTPTSLTYYDPKNVYVVSVLSTSKPEVDDEDFQMEEGLVDETLLPELETGHLVMISPVTWTTTDRYEFPVHEVPFVVKAVELEISEVTKERKVLIAVGTGLLRGENSPARGAVYVFDVIDVVPEIGKPETGKKFKLISREEVKGVVSTLAGMDGYLLITHGQKCMIRGLKEDGSLLPVAFMDMNTHTTVAKTLEKMVMFGDVLKGVSFVGFSEEPYKMILFGKDPRQLSITAGDFLPAGTACYFVVADAQSNIHVLQYDPENPKSIHGNRLLPKGEIYCGHEVKSICILPKKKSLFTEPDEDDMDEDEDEEFLCMFSTMTGVFGTVSSITESMYRRLNVIQGQITNTGEHIAGLNPRAYRAAKFRNTSSEPMRAILDGKLLVRWLMLGAGRRKELAGRAGTSEEMLREDLWFLQDATAFF